MSQPKLFNIKSVRDWLNQEQYTECLPAEALSLVKHLIVDLVAYKEKSSKLEKECKQKNEECQALKVSLEPYQLENGLLHKQNSQHHMDKIHLKEQIEKSQKEKKNAVEKLEKECSDFRFLVGELKSKLTKLEKESSEKSSTILRLQDKNLKAVIVTPEGTNTAVPYQRQRMEMSSILTVPPATHTKCAQCGCSSKKRAHDVYTADLLRLTDHKMLELKHELEKYKGLLKENRQNCEELQQKVLNRDSEIARLQGILEGGRTVNAILEDNELRVARARIHELQLENDVLKTSKNHLDAKLNVVHGKTHEAMSRAVALANENKGLTHDLHDAESTNRLLEQDVACTAEVLLTKLNRTKERLDTCEADLAEQHRLFHLMKDERDRLKDELQRANQGQSMLLQEREPLIQDNRQMEGVLKRGQEEKKKMADKLNHLTVHLQESDMEKQRLESEVATLRSTIARMERSLKETQAARDQFRQSSESWQEQNDNLLLQKKMLDADILKLKEIKAQLEQEKSYYKDQILELQGLKESAEQARDYYSTDVEKQQMQLHKLESDNELLTDRLAKAEIDKEEFEQEKDHYSEQVKQLLDILKSRPSMSRSQSISREPKKMEEELCRLEYENDILKQERNFYKVQYQSHKNRTGGQGAASPPSNGVRESPPIFPALSVHKKIEEDKDVDVEQLRTEREFFRKQMEHFQQLYNDAKGKLLRGPLSPVSDVPSRRSVSPPSETSSVKDIEVKALKQEIMSQQQEKDFFREQYERLKNTISKPMDAVDEDLDTLVQERNMFQAERDFYMTQYKDLSEKMSQFALTPHGGKSKKAKHEIDVLLAEKRHVVLSKAELEAEVRNLRQHVSELEQDNHTLDSQTRALNKTVESLQDSAVQKFPPSMQAFVAEIRKSRDAALAEVAQVKEDRDSIRQKLKSLNLQLHKETANAQEDILALRHKNDETEDFSADLQQRLQSQAVLIASLQEQTDALKGALKQTQNELGHSTKQCVQLRKNLDMKSGEIGTQGEQLGQSVSQLQEARMKITKLENELEETLQTLLKSETENKGLKGNLGQLDHDKDLLNSDLTSKTEIISALRAEIRQKTISIAELEGTICKMERQIESCEMSIETEKRRVQDETERNQRFQQDLAVSTEQKEAANKEIRRQQNEIVGYTRDIHELQAELEKTRAAREAFKIKAQEYCRTLEDLTHSISNKDSEQNELMKQYLTLNETVSSLKTLNASLEEDAATKTKEMIQMDDLIKNFKEERQQLVDEINQLSNKTDELEAKSSKLEQEKFDAEKDLLATRDLNQKIDARREENENEVHRLSMMLQKVLDNKNSLELQLESLADQLSSERSAVRSLEDLLNEKRKSEFICESTNKQLEVERNQLQRKVSELKDQLDDEISETRRLRSRTAQSEVDIERLRRELTNEKYERERASQELRRVQKYTHMSSALMSLDQPANVKRTPTPPIGRDSIVSTKRPGADVSRSSGHSNETSGSEKEPWKIAFDSQSRRQAFASKSKFTETQVRKEPSDSFYTASLACLTSSLDPIIPITVPQGGSPSTSDHS